MKEKYLRMLRLANANILAQCFVLVLFNKKAQGAHDLVRLEDLELLARRFQILSHQVVNFGAAWRGLIGNGTEIKGRG